MEAFCECIGFLRAPQLTVLSSRGKEATIALLGDGDFIGEDCIASDQPLRATFATTITNCCVLKIEREALLKVIHREHAFSDLLVAYLVRRHNQTREDLVDQLFNSAEKRLARTLLMLAQFGKEQRMENVIPRISQETLAEMVGTTRARVNFFMNRFRQLGLIDYNGGWRFIVHCSTSCSMNRCLLLGTPCGHHRHFILSAAFKFLMAYSMSSLSP